MAFIRKIKKGDAIYLAKVESYREDGKVKQRVLEYVGKEENGQPVHKLDVNRLEVENVQCYADIKILYQLAIELKLNYLLGKHHKQIIALLIAHLLCKSSVLKIGAWIQASALKEILGTDDLSTEALYQSLDHLEACPFEKVEQGIFDYWVQIAPTDNKTFVLDVTDTYHNGSQSQCSH